MLNPIPNTPLPDSTFDIAILGGGVIGLCAAWRLARSGLSVAVLDRAAIGNACSHGNAGMLVPSHIVPLAAPGMIAKGMRYMFDQSSPFYIKPRLNLELLSWTLKFRAACTQARVDQSLPILHRMTLESTAMFDDIAAETGRSFGLNHRGILLLHQTQAGRKENMELAETALSVGLPIQNLEGDDLRALEPVVPQKTTGGVLFERDCHLDPAAFMNAMHHHLAAKGVSLFPHTDVTGFVRDKGQVNAVTTPRGQIRAKYFVAACGSWSPQLLRELDLKLPIQPAKGYSVTLPTPAKCPAIPQILTDAHVAITPMNNGLRFAGTLELAGLDGRINRKRVAAILRTVPDFIPGWSLDQLNWDKVWYGYRPASPDGLPFVGRVPGADNVIVAAGHAMLGVTLAPITGNLVAQLITGASIDYDMDALSPARFN